jgi:cell division topological specificity factor
MKVWQRLQRRREPPSGEVARDRLRLVLAYDRADISPGLLETLKDEIIDAISRHITIDADSVEVVFREGVRESRLIADIPLKVNRRRRKG